jgi:L-fucose isomerase-like protein
MTTISARRARPPQLPSPVGPAAVSLLEQARHGLREAATMPAAPDRYAGAHLAALRAAAAVLAARAQATDPRVRRRRPTSAWVLLTAVAPELGEWAAFFAAGAGKRAAAEAGVEHAVTSREADDLVRDVETFVALVETTLGLLPGPRVAAMAG